MKVHLSHRKEGLAAVEVAHDGKSAMTTCGTLTDAQTLRRGGQRTGPRCAGRGSREGSTSDSVTMCPHPLGEDSRSGTPRPTASPKPASRTGKAHWFLSTQPPRHATVVKRDGVGFHRDCIPPPQPCPQVRAPAVRPARWGGPELPHVFPTDVDAANAVKRVGAGHRPATAEPDDCQNRGRWIPPPGISRGPLTGVSAGQRPSHALGGR